MLIGKISYILTVKKITEKKINDIPYPAIIRLCAIYKLLDESEQKSSISSTELGERLGVGAHNIRKDIGFLGVAGSSGAGYDVEKLRGLIAERLGLTKVRTICIVGLGRLGTAMLQYPMGSKFRIIAGFDSNVNRLETIKTDIDLYPSYQMSEVVRRLNIDIAIVAVPASSAQDVSDRLIDGGIKGIINFAPVYVRSKNSSVFVKNMDIAGELSVLSAQIDLFTGC